MQATHEMTNARLGSRAFVLPEFSRAGAETV